MSETKTIEIIELTELVPLTWVTWFYALISEGAPFSWGDNNRTLVTAERLSDHVANVIDIAVESEGVSQEDADFFLAELDKLGQTYIDLEN